MTPEILSFPSRTPQSFAQILHGIDALSPIDIRGLLSLPARASGKLPLIVMCIGSLGMTSGREEMYAGALTAAGMAVLIVDGNTPRGVAETVSNQGSMPWPACAVDALYALRFIRNDPRIDAARIALLGYSRGGCVSVMAYDERLQKAVAGEARFAAHVALYPPCYIRWEHPHPTGASLLMLLGSADDLAPEAQGREYAEALEAVGGRVEIVVVPGAYHSFDANMPAGPTASDNLAVRTIRVDDAGEMIEHGTGIRAGNDWPGFLKALAAAPGARRGGTSGNGPNPQDVAVAPIVAFLRRELCFGGAPIAR
jgi:dienelactone hydrolase